MKDKKVLISGATSGIGRATAVLLAQSGFSLILLGRNAEKGKVICHQIEKLGNPGVKFYKADFFLMKEVASAAEKIKKEHKSINVLINNAGARFLNHAVSDEGVEQTLAVNYLSHFLLTRLLIEKLEKASSARIINVSSGAHYGGKGIIENITTPQQYDGKQQYSDSKLANVLFTYHLAEKLKDTKVTVNAADPGGVATNFARNNGLFQWIKHRIYYLLKGELLSPMKGADTVFHLSASAQVKGITGKYFYRKKDIRSAELSYNKEMQEQLWNLSLDLIGSIVPGFKKSNYTLEKK
jgi:NAD(P)-dependent dehydrogenase (short-subunit alcohol dehydrogenase family)